MSSYSTYSTRPSARSTSYRKTVTLESLGFDGTSHVLFSAVKKNAAFTKPLQSFDHQKIKSETHKENLADSLSCVGVCREWKGIMQATIDQKMKARKLSFVPGLTFGGKCAFIHVYDTFFSADTFGVVNEPDFFDIDRGILYFGRHYVFDRSSSHIFINMSTLLKLETDFLSPFEGNNRFPEMYDETPKRAGVRELLVDWVIGLLQKDLNHDIGGITDAEFEEVSKMLFITPQILHIAVDLLDFVLARDEMMFKFKEGRREMAGCDTQILMSICFALASEFETACDESDFFYQFSYDATPQWNQWNQWNNENIASFIEKNKLLISFFKNMSLKEADDAYETRFATTMRTLFGQVSKSELVYVSSKTSLVLAKKIFVDMRSSGIFDSFPDEKEWKVQRAAAYLSALVLHFPHGFKNSLIAATAVFLGFMFCQTDVNVNEVLCFFAKKKIVADFEEMMTCTLFLEDLILKSQILTANSTPRNLFYTEGNQFLARELVVGVKGIKEPHHLIQGNDPIVHCIKTFNETNALFEKTKSLISERKLAQAQVRSLVENWRALSSQFGIDLPPAVPGA